MVHKSDLSWTAKVNNPGDIYHKGDDVEAIILSINHDEKKVSLGVKQLYDDPWPTIFNELPPGKRVEAKVISIVDYGVFVRIREGIEALIPQSDVIELAGEDGTPKPAQDRRRDRGGGRQHRLAGSPPDAVDARRRGAERRDVAEARREARVPRAEEGRRRMTSAGRDHRRAHQAEARREARARKEERREVRREACGSRRRREEGRVGPSSSCSAALPPARRASRYPKGCELRPLGVAPPQSVPSRSLRPITTPPPPPPSAKSPCATPRIHWTNALDPLHRAWEVLHSTWEVLHSAWEVLHSAWEVLHSAWELLHSAWEVLHSDSELVHSD